jgi:hypothetical protein
MGEKYFEHRIKMTLLFELGKRLKIFDTSREVHGEEPRALVSERSNRLL